MKCANCLSGYLLPLNSLDYDSHWKCKLLEPMTEGCGNEMTNDDIDKLVDEIEEVCT